MTDAAPALQPWARRPTEEAAFFNPAFCGELLCRTYKEFWRVSGVPFSVPVSFVVLPLLLHPYSRQALPHKSNVGFATWAADNDAVLSQMPERILKLRPVTREALLFLAQTKAININGEGVTVGSSPLRLSAKIEITTPEVDEMRRASGLLGRWFAGQATPSLVMQSLGVTV